MRKFILIAAAMVLTSAAAQAGDSRSLSAGSWCAVEGVVVEGIVVDGVVVDGVVVSGAAATGAGRVL